VLHEDRVRADSFGADADQYDRFRPAYPAAMIDELVAGDPRLLPTHSDHRTLPPAQLADLLDAVGQVIDRFGGSFSMHYDTVLLTAVRL